MTPTVQRGISPHVWIGCEVVATAHGHAFPAQGVTRAYSRATCVTGGAFLPVMIGVIARQFLESQPSRPHEPDAPRRRYAPPFDRRMHEASPLGVPHGHAGGLIWFETGLVQSILFHSAAACAPSIQGWAADGARSSVRDARLGVMSVDLSHNQGREGQCSARPGCRSLCRESVRRSVCFRVKHGRDQHLRHFRDWHGGHGMGEGGRPPKAVRDHGSRIHHLEGSAYGSPREPPGQGRDLQRRC
ncbi:uncharacterized protein F5Z01DRAFT_468920 [Emericellopsis atlantica]|uniref:Uncharacterized protein n=1 Tax=Emericellopsis atlantica TaxID=2614577 RepID=A0A9P8CLK1_9HYPO|nr:uncharacterized protein F5Z01DRAFT_468920 [Emericellopsis atlantica]KAG9249691.1 hypothetical protein F5Z01DRAFT_468920 [Emericellopsis atlantica]